MSLVSKSLVLSHLLVVIHAVPAPATPNNTLGNSVCNLNYDNPADTWKNSGAASYLNGFLQHNQDLDWSNKIDKNCSQSQQESTLHCVDLSGGDCPAPTTGSCMSFASPACYHIRNAMSSCHGVFSAVRTTLTESTLEGALKVEQIGKDFGDKIPKKDNVLHYLSAALSIVSTFSGVAAPALTVVGPAGPAAAQGISVAAEVFSTIFQTVDDTQKPPEGDGTSVMIKDQLLDMYQANRESIDKTARTVFGGGQDTAKLKGLSAPDGETENIAKFFSGGKYLLKNSDKGAIHENVKNITDTAALHLRQALVGLTLKEQNHFVFAQTEPDGDACQKRPGSSLIDGQCFSIIKYGKRPGIFKHHKVGYEYLDKDRANKLTSDDYKFDLVAFYKNVDACQQANPNFDGSVRPSYETPGDSLPPCFFNLPVIKAKKNPCGAPGESDPKGKDAINNFFKKIGVNGKNCKEIKARTTLPNDTASVNMTGSEEETV